MSSTGADVVGTASPDTRASSEEKKKQPASGGDADNPEAASVASAAADHTQRRLKARHIQLMGR